MSLKSVYVSSSAIFEIPFRENPTELSLSQSDFLESPFSKTAKECCVDSIPVKRTPLERHYLFSDHPSLRKNFPRMQYFCAEEIAFPNTLPLSPKSKED
ncbi:hypothetical protein CEXT_337871 [Caerostris extrusa]|uniref:Uncharacterized protein n=1 Tax=Caerostris extrusa TaxID=172846 RepID=A0AAV4TBG7_CAEEX|nr:hypothetical protein CEXT_337871 [Caerostris extrusa]